MAQNPGQDQEEFDPATLLLQTLQQSSADLTEEASVQMIQSSAEMIQNETVSQVPGIFDQDLNALYERISGPAKTIFPDGTKIFGKVQKTVDSATGHITITNTPEPVKTNVNPAQTARNVIQSASQSFPISFDVEKELGKLKGLRGEELSSAITSTLATIDTEITKQRQLINKQAAVESGYIAAQTALERSLQAEHIPNPNFGGLSFNQRFGFASAQTQQAESFASTTRVQMMALEKSMIERDLSVSRLVSAKQAILKIEMRTAERQMKEDDRLDAITSQQVANYKFIYGKDLDDLTARRAIVNRAAQDKIVAKTVAVTPENVYTIILDPELRVRENALKLVLEYDKATNNLDSSATQTPITERIKEFVKEPIKLLDAVVATGAIPEKEADTLRTQWIAADTKERASLQQGAFASLLEKYIERQYEVGYDNMKKWKANEMDIKSPLGSVIDRISKTNSAGKANLNTVIETFIMDQTIKGADGQVIPYEQRLAILDSALGGAISNEFKSILYPNTDSLRIKMSNKIRNAAARAYIKVKTISPDTGLWEYRRDLGSHYAP